MTSEITSDFDPRLQRFGNVHEVARLPRGWSKMRPSNPNAHTYVNGTDVETRREENLIDVATRGCSQFLYRRQSTIARRQQWGVEGGM